MTISYARSTVGDEALEELNRGNLHPGFYQEKVRFSLGRWFKSHPCYRHELSVGGMPIVTYWSDEKAEINPNGVLGVLKGAAIVGQHIETFDEVFTNVKAWRVKAFDLRNYYRYGLTVGTVVEVDDPNYFGGKKVRGEVIEIDYDNEVLPIMTKFEGWPYLFFDAKELKVISQPSFVPLMALSLERAN